MTLTFDLLTSKSIGRILDSWWVSVWSFMIIGWLQSQLSSGNHFQITMRHDLDLSPFDPKINRAHPWLMGSKCMKFHDHRWITESVIVRKLVWRTDRLTDRQTDWRTDRVQTYSPLRFHRWGTKNKRRTTWIPWTLRITLLLIRKLTTKLLIWILPSLYRMELGPLKTMTMLMGSNQSQRLWMNAWICLKHEKAYSTDLIQAPMQIGSEPGLDASWAWITPMTQRNLKHTD